ncbi:MAG: hypothetical protein HY922_13915 [Elusimicrobia bacterium]|nr:hypothetical protein [Elusimicrobiota bacterium]
MKIVGRRGERPISFSASAALLAEGARFNEEFQKLPIGQMTAIPKGSYRFQSHEDADLHSRDCVAACMAHAAKARA